MLRDFKIRTKLLIGLALIVLFVGFSGLMGIWGTKEISRAFHIIANESAPSLQALLEIKSTAHEIEAQTVAFEFIKMESTISEGTPGGDKKFSLLEKVEKLEMWTERYGEYQSKAGVSKLGFLEKVRQVKDNVVVVSLEFIRLKELGAAESELIPQKKKLEEARAKLKDVIHEAVDEELQNFHKKQQTTDQIVNKTIKINFMTSVCALILAVMIGFLLSDSIAKPIIRLRNIVLAFAGGKLDQRIEIKSRDEIGDLCKSFNTMADQIQQEIKCRNQEEEKFRAVVESAPYGLITTNDQGKILLVNSELEKMFGYRREELAGQVIEKLIPKRFHHKHVEDRTHFFVHSSARRMGSGLNIMGLHKNGHEFPVDVSLNPIKTPEGVVVLATIADLTERKRLESIVLQSEKMSAIGQLAGGVAHEINNPLGVILWFSQNVVKRIKSGDPLEMPLKSIEREALRCKSLVQDLLTFSRVGKSEKELIDLIETIEGAFSLVLAQSKVKNVDLIKEFSEVPKIMANQVQIQQIVINLSNNAIDAMPNGGKLFIRVHKGKIDSSEAIEIEVQDTGQGVPKDIQSKIFNPFFTTKEIGKGTGLGLSLVYEIVQKHNGKILLDSEVGKGTTFRVLLPLS